MKNRFLQYLFLSCSLMVLFSACRKDPHFDGKETFESGKTYVWVTEAYSAGGDALANNQFFDVFTNIKQVKMFSVRRDAASKADLQKAVTVKLDSIPIAEYNTKHGTSYTLLPSSIYTLVPEAGVSMTDASITMKFAGGDFAKNVILAVDGSKVDLSKQYAVAYVISNFGGFSKKTSADTIVATIAIKNRWDGVYTEKGTFQDLLPADAAFTDINVYLGTDGPMQYELRTTSATQCIVYDNFLHTGNATPVSVDAAGSDATYFGNTGLVLNFDPATNKVSSAENYYVNNSQHRTIQLDPSGINAYDPTSKVIPVKFFMIQPGLGLAGDIRLKFDWTLTYLKSR